jgi:hypothetical protein
MDNGVEIRLRSSTRSEARTRAAINKLLAKYDLKDWIFTNIIEIDESCRPHSHPIVTLNTENEKREHLLLSEFVHEQLHWYEEQHADKRDRAIEVTARYYAEVPAARPEGAGDEWSTRLHLLVCALEYQVMKRLIGTRAARQTMVALSRHHYRWIYKSILKDEAKLLVILRECGLWPSPLGPALDHS